MELEHIELERNIKSIMLLIRKSKHRDLSNLAKSRQNSVEMPDFLLGFAAFYQMIYVLLLSHFSRVRLCVTHQAPLSTGFSRQEYWSRLPFPSPNDIYACDQNNLWILNNKTAIM